MSNTKRNEQDEDEGAMGICRSKAKVKEQYEG